MNIQRKWLAIGLALTAGIAVAAGAAATDEKENTSLFGGLTGWWQKELIPRIQEAAGNRVANPVPVTTTSTEFREEKDRYLLRITLPDRAPEKVEVDLSGDTLRITAPAEGGLPRYEQSVLVPAAADDVPRVERKPGEHLLAITVAKTALAADPFEEDFGVFADPFPFSGGEKDLFARMDHMHQRMNRLWKEMAPGAFRFRSAIPEKPSPEIEDKDDAYVIRVALSGQPMENIDLKVEERILRIEVKAEDRKEQEGTVRDQRVHSTRMLTLPGPVDPAKMTTERVDGVLKVTLPKAG